MGNLFPYLIFFSRRVLYQKIGEKENERLAPNWVKAFHLWHQEVAFRELIFRAMTYLAKGPGGT